MISRALRDLAGAWLRWRPRDDEDFVEGKRTSRLEAAPVASASFGSPVLGSETAITTGVAGPGQDDAGETHRTDAPTDAVLRAQVEALNALAVELRSVRSRLTHIERSALIRSPRSTIGIGIVLGLIFLWLLSVLLALVVGLSLLVTGILFGL